MAYNSGETPWILFMNAVCRCVALILLWTAGSVSAAAVAVTVKPLHSIVAAVMQGVDQPVLLLDGTVSPHVDRIRPSTLRQIRSADLLLWVGPGLESFLAPAVEDIPAGVHVLTASALALPVVFELRDGHQAGTAAAPIDPHLWLDPENAAALASLVSGKLATLDPSNASRYHENAVAFSDRMKSLETFGLDSLASTADMPFILFHDFIQYFEKRFGLNNAGVVTYQPQITASAKHLRVLNNAIEALDVQCVLTEPQFEQRARRSLNQLTSVTTAVVDPLASGYEAGPMLYETWFKDMVIGIQGCLKAERP
jgi:zinc transport system substrate-binding protein